MPIGEKYLMTSLFILGATGYIGGSVLAALKKEYPSNLKITALVRNEKDFPAVRALGIDIVHGTKADLDKIRDAASDADIVLAALDNDDVPLVQAIIAGLETRAKTASKKPILIHTSGTGVIGEDGKGNFKETKTYNDNSEDDIRSIPATNVHRPVDLEIFKADETGNISGYIIAPAAIYGPGTGPVRRVSMGLQLMVHVALKRKAAIIFDQGTAVWSDVHIDDVVALYLLVFKLALSGADKNKSYGKFYFASARPLVWRDWSKTINKALMNKGTGLVDTLDPVRVTVADEPYLWFCETNTLPVADRAASLGWKPSHPSFEETLPSELDALLKPMW